MILYPREYQSFKEAVFSALAAESGGGRALWVIPLSFLDWPETWPRVEAALARAKRQPRSQVGRWFKRQLIRGQYNWARRYFVAHPEEIAVAWNGLTGSRKAFLDGARDAGAAVLHVELAPFPGRVTLDTDGVNFESSVPRNPDFFFEWAKGNPARMDENWRKLSAKLSARPSRRRDVKQHSGVLPDSPFLFCPLQVPRDSQITLFSGWAKDLPGFLSVLARAVEALPEGWHLRLKEHPSSKLSLLESLAPVLATGRAVLDNATDSFEQLAASRGVVTVNSSMGIQAFFFDKPVIVAGQAFFGVPGLTEPCSSETELQEAFAKAEQLEFDSKLRSAFMTWLDREYYPEFSISKKNTTYDRKAFARALARAEERRC
jgi:capsular polysaccharide export protein